MPLLSIIVPVYNVEMYLAECLDSLLAQTFKNMEIICVNDGSTDDSGAILDRYAAQYPNIIKLITQVNQGPSAARNAAISIAEGSFIAFCDGDDTVYPQAYETALACFSDDVDSVCFGAEMFYDSPDTADNNIEKLKKEFAESVLFGTKEGITDGSTVYPYILKHENGYVWNKIYRTATVKKANLTFREGYYIEDLLFNYCFFSFAPKTYLLPKALYRYRIRPDSILGTSRRDIKDYHKYLILMLRDLYDFYYKNRLFPEYESYFMYLCNYNIDNHYTQLPRDERIYAVCEIEKLFKKRSIHAPQPGTLLDCIASGAYTLQ